MYRTHTKGMISRFIFEELLYATLCKMTAYLIFFFLNHGGYCFQHNATEGKFHKDIKMLIPSPSPRRHAGKLTAINFYSLVLFPNMVRSYPKDYTRTYALLTA